VHVLLEEGEERGDIHDIGRKEDELDDATKRLDGNDGVFVQPEFVKNAQEKCADAVGRLQLGAQCGHELSNHSPKAVIKKDW